MSAHGGPVFAELENVEPKDPTVVALEEHNAAMRPGRIRQASQTAELPCRAWCSVALYLNGGG